MSIVEKLKRGFEPRIEAIEQAIREMQTLLSGPVSTNVGDLPARVLKLENELRMLKARMAKKEPEAV